MIGSILGGINGNSINDDNDYPDNDTNRNSTNCEDPSHPCLGLVV